MSESLGVDGPLERYSRGLDTWVPLDSEASFAAMKRSIDVQRKAGEGNRARVLLRIKDVKLQAPPTGPTLPSLPLMPPIVLPGATTIVPPRPIAPTDSMRMSFRPFARELPPPPPPPPLPATPEQRSSVDQQRQQLPPPPPPLGQPVPPQAMSGLPPAFFHPPPGPPGAMQVPPPPPPFPFDHRARFFPAIPHGIPRVNPPMVPQSMPIPPLVPERPNIPLNPLPGSSVATKTARESKVDTEKTDAEMVLEMLGELETKMQGIGTRMDQMQLEEKKHYESIRRGLKRLKEDKSMEERSEDLRAYVAAPNANGEYPCCICNFCLKRNPDSVFILTIADVVTYVICGTCENFTLCIDCFMGNKYQHHPSHTFSLKNNNLSLSSPKYQEVIQRLSPGRGLKHRAHCDACKQVIPEHDLADSRTLWALDINVSNVATMIYVIIASNVPLLFTLNIVLPHSTIIFRRALKASLPVKI